MQKGRCISMYVCKSEVTKVPLKYRLASKKKVAETLSKMPAPKPARKEIVVQTARGKIVF